MTCNALVLMIVYLWDMMLNCECTKWGHPVKFDQLEELLTYSLFLSSARGIFCSPLIAFVLARTV